MRKSCPLSLPSSDEEVELVRIKKQKTVPDSPEIFGCVSYRLDLMSIKSFYEKLSVVFTLQRESAFYPINVHKSNPMTSSRGSFSVKHSGETVNSD